MSGTLLEHPVVREYLRQLSAACASLPVAQARELRDQIVAHLDEALPPGASDEEVLDELGRLGSPRTLAAIAAGPGPRPLLRRLRNRAAHVRWWAWLAAAMVVAAAGSGLGYVLLALNATPLAEASGAHRPRRHLHQDRGHSAVFLLGHLRHQQVAVPLTGAHAVSVG